MVTAISEIVLSWSCLLVKFSTTCRYEVCYICFDSVPQAEGTFAYTCTYVEFATLHSERRLLDAAFAHVLRPLGESDKSP